MKQEREVSTFSQVLTYCAMPQVHSSLIPCPDTFSDDPSMSTVLPLQCCTMFQFTHIQISQMGHCCVEEKTMSSYDHLPVMFYTAQAQVTHTTTVASSTNQHY